MGRPLRIQFAGACYHITLMGNNRQDIFLGNQDRRTYLQLLKAYKERFGLKVYAYCLMQNSIQLVLETPQPNLSRIMQGFNTAYTKFFNQQHGTLGHVFQGRYRAVLVDRENRLLDATIHVHLSPVREGLKEKPWRYLWSSCAAYVESEERDLLVDSREILRRIAKIRLKQSVVYLHMLKESARQGGGAPLSGDFLGDARFVEEARRAAGLEEAVGRGAGSEARAQEILDETVRKHGVDGERLLGRGQWRDLTPARKEAVYRIWKEARLGVSEIAKMFNRTPSAISQIIKAVELSKK